MKRVRLVTKQLGAGLLAVLLCAMCTLCAWAAPKPDRVLRVAYPEAPGICEFDEAGNPKGLLVDYLNEIAKYTNWEYEYVTGEIDTLMEQVATGELDLMGGTYVGFEDLYSYPKYSMGRSQAILLCRKSDSTLESFNLNSLNGKTIGVYANARTKIHYLQEFLNQNELDCQLRVFSYEELLEAGETLYPYLENGDVDLLLANELEHHTELRTLAVFDAQPYYIVTTLGNDEVLTGLNRALQKILDSSPNFAEERYASAFPNAQGADLQFNQEERAYIESHANLSVAIVRNWHPFSCLENDGDHHNGILPDLLDKLSEYTGLRFTYVFADTYLEAIQSVQAGEADLLGCYLDQDEAAWDTGLVLTRPFARLNSVILKNKSVSFPEEGLTCGLLDGRPLPTGFPLGSISYYDNVQESVKAVNQGEVDYIYGIAATMEREMQDHRYNNIVPVTQSNSSTEISIALRRPVEEELLTILNKAIYSLSASEKSALLDRNLESMAYSTLGFYDWVYANPMAFITLTGTFFLLITLGVLLAVRVRMKNAVMRGKLAEAEAKSQAKSEFLSRMSHEIRTPMNAIMGLADLTCMEKDTVPKTIRENLLKIQASSQYLLSLISDILDMSRIENGKMEMGQEAFSLAGILDAIDAMLRGQTEQRGLSFQITRRIDHDFLVGDPVRLRQVLTNLLSNAIKFTRENGRICLLVEESDCEEGSASYRFSVQDNGVGIPLERQKDMFDSFEQLGGSSAKSLGTGLGLPISQSIVQAMGGELKVQSEPGQGSDFYFSLRLPFAEKLPDITPPKIRDSLDGARILVVEDNDLNAEIAMALLKRRGVQTTRAVDGQEAVDLFQSSEPGWYQIILMDVRMPRKDGFEATREIRDSDRPDAKTVPIIAMTADTFQTDLDQANETGMTGFVPKPVNAAYLYEVLQKNL